MILECLECGNPRIENEDLGLCASCNRFHRKSENVSVKDVAPMQKVSDKQAKLLQLYAKKKAKWIKGKKCRVFPELPAVDIHHMQGRVGYADEWARENEMPLLLDERFWLPVSRRGHKQIEENPVWAYENQYSFKRITDPIFRKTQTRE